jgi:hypothetical protein
MTEKKSKKSAVPKGKNIIEFPKRPARPLVTELTGSVNVNELTSIKALTSYVARNKNVPENVVSAYVEAQFNVSDLKELRREDFEGVIKFLVDLRSDLLIH